MWVHKANWFWKQKPVAMCINRKKEDQWWTMILLKSGANMQQIKRNNFELKSFCSRRHLNSGIWPAQTLQIKMGMNCSPHLNNADRLPWQMVGCVEEKGQEKNRTAIPAKDRWKQRCRVRLEHQRLYVFSETWQCYYSVYTALFDDRWFYRCN